MSPTSAPEKTGASGQYYSVPPPPPRRLMSPLGYLGVGVAMLITLVIVFRAASSFQGGGATTTVQDQRDTVDLGTFARELSPESGGFVREPFALKVVVVLNPKIRDRIALKVQVERRREEFRDIVWDHILDTKSDAELRKPAVIGKLKDEIRQRLNQELGGGSEEKISRVVFPERRLPERR